MSEPKLCPYRISALVTNDFYSASDDAEHSKWARCLEDKCAMWRKRVSPDNEVAEGLPTQYVGYCGLAGKL